MQNNPPPRLRALLPFIKLLTPYRGWLLLGFILTVVTLFASVGLLSVSGWFLTGTALAGGTATLTAITYNFFQPAATVRGFALLRTAGRWAERVVNHEATFRLLAHYRRWLFAGIAPLSQTQLKDYHGGTLLNRMTRDIDALDNLYVRLLLPVAAALLLLILMTGVAAWFLPTLLIVFIGLILVGFILIPWLAWRLGKRFAPQEQEQQRRLRVELLELVDGLETLSLQQTAWQTHREKALAAGHRWLSLRRTLHGRATLLSQGLGAWIALTALGALALMSFSELKGIWVAGGTLMVLAAAELLVMLPEAWLKLPGTCTAATNLHQLHHSQSTIIYPTNSATQPTDNSFTLHKVNFSYANNINILNNVNLHLAAGTHCLIQGASGGGKTTLIQLLTRQLAQQDGEIQLGGVAITDFTEADLRQRIALAPQETYLFTDTLANNLRLACPDADDTTLWQALELVGLADAIRALPDGLQTWTDEGGASLSGGQRRRLGIARTLLVNADCIILDEPSEGLDLDSEARLINDVCDYLHGKTLLWISHRDTAIERFDRVLTLAEGNIEAST